MRPCHCGSCWTPPLFPPSGEGSAATSTSCSLPSSTAASTSSSPRSSATPSSSPPPFPTLRWSRSPARSQAGRRGSRGSRPDSTGSRARCGRRSCTARTTRCRGSAGVPCVVTAHDATFFTPPRAARARQGAASSGGPPGSRCDARRRVVVPSRATATEIARHTGADATTSARRLPRRRSRPLPPDVAGRAGAGRGVARPRGPSVRGLPRHPRTAQERPGAGARVGVGRDTVRGAARTRPRRRPRLGRGRRPRGRGGPGLA